MLNLPKRHCRLLLVAAFFAIPALLSATPSALAVPTSHHDTNRAAHHHRGRRRKPGTTRGGSAAKRAQSTLASLLTAPTLLGEEGVQSQHDYLSAGQAEAFRFRALATGETGTLHLYLDSRNRARTVVVGVYASANGHPGALLSTGSANSSTAGAWIAVPISQTALLSGGAYWIAILGEGGTLRFRDRGNGPCPSESSAQTNLGALPTSWTTGPLYADCPVSAYVSSASLPIELPKEGSTPPIETPKEKTTPPVEQPKEKTTPPVEPPPPPAAPANMKPPAITGTTTKGQVLDTTTGTWTGSPTSYSYKWQDCRTSGASCSNISGATSASYELASGDVGHTVRAVVTATNEGGSTPATSNATAMVAQPAPPAETPKEKTPPAEQPKETTPPVEQPKEETPPSGGTGGAAPPPSPACTTTVSSVSRVASAVSSAAAGSAVCLTAGSYGHLTLSGGHSGNVTVEPVPGASASLEGATVASNSSYITIHNFNIGGGVNLGYGDSHITVDHNNINGQAPGNGGEGVEDLTVNCSAPNAPYYSGCTSTAPDTYITINGNQIHGYGMGGTEDAIHLNNWEHVTITANDIYDLEEHGNHTDAMQSVFGGHYMTFAYNYEHDNQSQGFFIKDGDVSEVSVSDNLFLRNNNEPGLYPGGEYNIQVFNTTGLTIANNTVWDGQNDIIRAEGAAEALTANVNHNVEQGFDVLHEGGPAYTLTEDYDIFAEEPWTFKMGSHSKVQSSPDFVDPAGEDYELASNPNDIGVDWQPSEYVYGPTGD